MKSMVPPNSPARMLMDASPLSYCIVDKRSGTLQEWNCSFSALCSIAPKAGMNLTELGFPQNMETCIAEQSLALERGLHTAELPWSDLPDAVCGSEGGVGVRLIYKDAAAGQLLLQLRRLKAADPEDCGAESALEEANRQLAEAATAARKANLAKSEFLANMSHEIRTPLNAILGLARLILRTHLTPKQREFLGKIDLAGQSLLRIINDILDFSKVETGKMSIEDKPFYVENVIRGVKDIISLRIAEKGLSLDVFIAPDVRGEFIGDSFRLSQVLTNLATNAAKFTSAGGIFISVMNEGCLNGEYLLHFIVKDTGIGISSEQLTRLFSPFTQGDSSMTRRYGGTGLGLALCKKLTALMGGDIWCESEPGAGATFHFTCLFPRAPEIERQGGVPKNFAALRVLVADADDLAFETIYNILYSLGCLHVERAYAAIEALVRAEAEPAGNLCDLLLLSTKLPDIDEFEEYLRSPLVPHQILSIPRIYMVEVAVAVDARSPAKAAGRAGIAPTLLQARLTQSSLFEAITSLFGYDLGVAAQDQEQERKIVEAFVGSKILLVEDNEINQMVAEELLSQAGLKVSIAANGLDALRMLDEQDFDLVLMDIQMPEMDGLAATRRLREQERFRNLPVIAMTAHAMADDRQKSLDAGMNAHITKPIDSEELFTSLALWLGSKRNAG